jgi:hypothetical protein
VVAACDDGRLRVRGVALLCVVLALSAPCSISTSVSDPRSVMCKHTLRFGEPTCQPNVLQVDETVQWAWCVAMDDRMVVSGGGDGMLSVFMRTAPTKCLFRINVGTGFLRTR